MTLVSPFATTGVCGTGVQWPASKPPVSSSTQALLVPGQRNSNQLAELKDRANAGDGTWKIAVLVTLPCGVTMVRMW